MVDPNSHPPVIEQCGTCRFHIKDECHFNPPVAAETTTDRFPMVRDTDWCGHWEWNRIRWEGEEESLTEQKQREFPEPPDRSRDPGRR